MTHLGLSKLYAKCGTLEDLRKLVDYVHQKKLRLDKVTWTTIIAAVAQHGDIDTALQCFQQMKKEVATDKITWNTLISVVGRNGNGEEVERIFKEMQNDGTYLKMGSVLVKTFFDNYLK